MLGNVIWSMTDIILNEKWIKARGYNTVNRIIRCNSQCINSLYNTYIIEITIALTYKYSNQVKKNLHQF